MATKSNSKSINRFVEALTGMIFFILIGPPVGGLVTMATTALLSPASHLSHTPQTLWWWVSTVLWMITLVPIFIAMMSYFYGGGAAALTGLIVGYFADNIVGAKRNTLTAMLIGGCLGAAISPVAGFLNMGGGTGLGQMISFHDIGITIIAFLDILVNPQRAYRDIIEFAPVTFYPGFAGGMVATLLYSRNFRRRAEKQIDPAGG